MTTSNSTRSSGDERLSLIDHLAQWINWPRFIFSVILIFFLIAAGTGFGAYGAVTLASQRLFDQRQRLRLERLTKPKN